MKRLTTLILSGVLFVAAPVATAPAQTGDEASQNQNRNNEKDDKDFPWGLLGLLGLGGLAGLKKRKDHDHHREVHTTGTPARTTPVDPGTPVGTGGGSGAARTNL